MNAIKRFTGSVTLLIVVPVLVVVIPVVMAKIGQLIGLWAFIDKLYPTALLFWSLLIVTRLAFMFGWYKLGELFVKRGEEHGFFWFKPEPSYHRDEPNPVDKSGEILLIIMLAIFAFVFAETAIRLSTWVYPFYLHPVG